MLGPGPTDFAGGDQVALADYHGADPTGVPAELASASLIERGEYLARRRRLRGLPHAPRAARRFAGGLAFVLPFGTLYSTNITPDKETGIGAWSDARFPERACTRASAVTARSSIRRCPSSSYT